MPAGAILSRIKRSENRRAGQNDDRGFGFIAPESGGSDIFVHISAFPRDGAKPTLNEQISYEVRLDDQGKERAVSVMRAGATTASDELPEGIKIYGVGHKLRAFLSASAMAALAVAIAYVVVANFEAISSWFTSERPVATEAKKLSSAPASPNFRCDGRTHCSQMTSCEEATYFLKHCPGVAMGGNHDGEPCERQWCN